MLSEERVFMIRGDDGEEYGPVEMKELREWVQENRAGLGTTVRLDEPNARWHPWQYYPELVALLAEVHASSLIPGLSAVTVAPMGRRVLAFITDMILATFLYTPIFRVLTQVYMPDWDEQVLALLNHFQAPSPQFAHEIFISNTLFDSILLLYMLGFHAAHGRTPGKSIMRLKVVDEAGQKPGFVKSLFRALIMIISLSFYGLPLAYAFFNPQRRTLHDFLAGTYVVEA